MWRKENPYIQFAQMLIGTATMENSVEVTKKLKVELPYGPAIPLLGIYPK